MTYCVEEIIIFLSRSIVATKWSRTVRKKEMCILGYYICQRGGKCPSAGPIIYIESGLTFAT